MVKIALGLLLGFFIGIGCRYFDVPLPGPSKFVGALVILSVTAGYLGADYLLVRHAHLTGRTRQSDVTALYCGGPTGLPASREPEAAAPAE